MSKSVWSLMLVCVIGTVASGQLLHPRYLGPLDDLTNLLSLPGFPDREPISMDLGRPMRVEVTPWSPRPSDEVVATISGTTFVPYLTAETIDVQIDGSEIRLDIHWISSPPPVSTTLMMEQYAAIGTVSEPVQFESPASLRSDRYEVSQSLGTFAPGAYTLEVVSTGRLTGTISTSFTVRKSFFDGDFASLFPGW